MFDIHVATDIAAPADTVWAVLTDFGAYARWNPFIRRARGTAQKGEDVHLQVRSPWRIPLRFRATVLDADEGRELHWEGHVLAGWLASGEHWFEIAPIDDGRVRFVQRERFSGLIPWLGARLLARVARRGFAAMNEALAAQAAHSHAAAGVS
jgi:hypothetical protein